jgi:hypothetical protein
MLLIRSPHPFPSGRRSTAYGSSASMARAGRAKAGWWPRFDEQVLSPLLAGRDATYQARDWTDWYGSTLGSLKTQRWSPTVILEGVTCTRRDTIGRLAYAIWVEAPADMRLARGMARDTRFPGKEDLWKQWMREEDDLHGTEPITRGQSQASRAATSGQPRTAFRTAGSGSVNGCFESVHTLPTGGNAPVSRYESTASVVHGVSRYAR